MQTRLSPWGTRARVAAAGLALLGGLGAAPARAADAEASADDAAPALGAAAGLRWTGYGTLGVMHGRVSEPWRYRRETGQAGARLDGLAWSPDTRFGLQGNWRLSPQWEGVAQLELQRRSPAANASDSVRWAFLSYTPEPGLRIRVGRTSPDFFLLVDYRNVGFAYPWVRASVEVYGWAPSKIDGINFTKVWTDGDLRWRLNAAAGRTAVLRDGPDPDKGARAHLWPMYGTSLAVEHGGLTVKLAVARGTTDHNLGPDSARAMLGAAASAGVPTVAAEAAPLLRAIDADKVRSTFLALSLGHVHGPWSLQAEYGAARADADIVGSDTVQASVAYRVDRLTFFGMAGAVRATGDTLSVPSHWDGLLAPALGPSLAAQLQATGQAVAQGANAARMHQNTLSAGLRWDFDDQMALKLQLDHIQVHANGAGLWSRATPAAAHANIVSATLDFIF